MRAGVGKVIIYTGATLGGIVVLLLIAPFFFLAVMLAVTYFAALHGPFVMPSGVDQWGLPKGRITAAQLAVHPEAQLYYPGATVESHYVYPQRYDLFNNGEQDARTKTDIRVKATVGQVQAWYRHWLVQHGWHTTNALWIPDDGYHTIIWDARGSREKLLVEVQYRAFSEPLPPAGWARVQVIYSIDPYQH